MLCLLFVLVPGIYGRTLVHILFQNEVITPDFPQTDVFNLVKAGAATAVFLNFSAISPGSGALLSLLLLLLLLMLSFL